MVINVRAVEEFGELLEKIAEPPANTQTVYLFAAKHGYKELAKHMKHVSWADFVCEMQEYMTIIDEFEAQKAEDEYEESTYAYESNRTSFDFDTNKAGKMDASCNP